MSAVARRAVLQPSRQLIGRAPARAASSTTEAASQTAQKAKEQASNITSKATEGLTRVTSAAGPALSKAGSAAANVANSAAQRTGGLIGRIQSTIPTVVYYSRVGLELSKLVFNGQKMNPPSVQQFQQYLQPVINGARNPSAVLAKNPGLLNPNEYVNTVRNLSQAQLVSAGIIFAEVLGFFTVGEMIGRFKLIGYRSPFTGAEHEHGH